MTRDTVNLVHPYWDTGPLFVIDDFFFGYARQGDGAWEWQVLARDTRPDEESVVGSYDGIVGYSATRERAVDECFRAAKRKAKALARNASKRKAKA